MKTMVRMAFARWRSAAEFNARRISATEFSTPLRGSKWAWVERAMILAREVLPVPGGPKSKIEVMRSASMARRRSFPGPRMCSCPVYSLSESGRMRSASGAFSAMLVAGCAPFGCWVDSGGFKNRSAMRCGTMHESGGQDQSASVPGGWMGWRGGAPARGSRWM